MIKTFRVLSHFLSYPGRDLQTFLYEGTGELQKEKSLTTGFWKASGNLQPFTQIWT